MSAANPTSQQETAAIYEPFAVAAALGNPLDAPAKSRVYTLVLDSEADVLLDRIFCRLSDAHQAVIHYTRSHMSFYHSAFIPDCPTCGRQGYWKPDAKMETPSYQCVTGHTWSPEEIANPEALTFEKARDLLTSAGVYVSITGHILGDDKWCGETY